jgi:hypothetical protein
MIATSWCSASESPRWASASTWAPLLLRLLSDWLQAPGPERCVGRRRHRELSPVHCPDRDLPLFGERPLGLAELLSDLGLDLILGQFGASDNCRQALALLKQFPDAVIAREIERRSGLRLHAEPYRDRRSFRPRKIAQNGSPVLDFLSSTAIAGLFSCSLSSRLSSRR